VGAKLVLAEGKNADTIAFITNLDVSERSAQDLVELYGKRWGIETSYRQKNDFKAKTCSKNYSIRLFYNMMSFILLNLYVLANYLVSTVLSENYSEVPIIAAKIFLTILLRKPPP